MDLNHLLNRHQISLMHANQTTNVTLRGSHRFLADHYAARVRDLQVASGAIAAPLMVV